MQKRELIKSSKDDKPGQRPGTDWRLTRYLLRHLIVGAASGWIFVGALLIFDVAGFRSLTANSPVGLLAIAMLLAVMTITWGAAAMGTAVFLMKDDGDDSNDKGRHAPIALRVEPAPAYASPTPVKSPRA
ncbi:MAG: hypothetical protein AAFX54_18190 [Pseudomonadota bacterium]